MQQMGVVHIPEATWVFADLSVGIKCEYVKDILALFSKKCTDLHQISSCSSQISLVIVIWNHLPNGKRPNFAYTYKAQCFSAFGLKTPFKNASSEFSLTFWAQKKNRAVFM